MKGTLAGAVAALMGLFVVGSTGHAQVPELRLSAPEATFPEQLSSVRGLRELPDGRVLVADGIGQALLAIDMSGGVADTIGRPGAGPEEYRQPDGLFPLPGGSTLMVDLGNGRLVVLGPDLAFGETTPLAQGTPGPGVGMSLRIPRAVDGDGRVYFQAMGGMGPGQPLPDSAMVLRWVIGSEQVDTVGRVKLDDRKRRSGGGPNNQRVEINPVPLSPQDGWAVAADGRVAMVRSIDYHVEWIGAGGRTVRGPPVPYDPVPIRQADKAEWLESLQRDGLSVMISVENGRRSVVMGRGMNRGGTPDADSYEWPSHKPPFRAAGVSVAPDGRLWVERYVAAGEEPRFDVFDESGRLVQQVVFPKMRRLIGFGAGVAYLVHADEFDLLTLEEYRLTS